MAGSKCISSGEVSSEVFQQILARYEPLIDSLSASKGAKPGQKTLQELDRFRFVEAPALFSQDDPKREMDHDDIKLLVDWKLRHGKFRPTLMKLVSSNESSTVQTTVEEGIESYRDSSNPSTAIKSLSRLKGIGPATASLLLAVHYPEQVLFFSDEAYYWLCNKGQRSSLKYNMTEYERLDTAAGRLIRRLGVSAMDVEKVAYVLFKEEVAPVPSTPDGLTLKSSKRESAKREPAKPAKSRPAKRKSNSDKAVEDHGPVTRSKRNKAA